MEIKSFRPPSRNLYYSCCMSDKFLRNDRCTSYANQLFLCSGDLNYSLQHPLFVLFLWFHDLAGMISWPILKAVLHVQWYLTHVWWTFYHQPIYVLLHGEDHSHLYAVTPVLHQPTWFYACKFQILDTPPNPATVNCIFFSSAPILTSANSQIYCKVHEFGLILGFYECSVKL